MEHRRDVLEPALPPPLDVSGWDIRKALGLLRRSNPPLLAVLWIERGYGMAPTELGTLVERIVDAGELRDAIDRLPVGKRAGGEVGRGPAIPAIGRFIDAELNRLAAVRPAPPAAPPDAHDLNGFFRDAVLDMPGAAPST